MEFLDRSQFEFKASSISLKLIANQCASFFTFSRIWLPPKPMNASCEEGARNELVLIGPKIFGWTFPSGECVGVFCASCES